MWEPPVLLAINVERVPLAPVRSSSVQKRSWRDKYDIFYLLEERHTDTTLARDVEYTNDNNLMGTMGGRRALPPW